MAIQYGSDALDDTLTGSGLGDTLYGGDNGGNGGGNDTFTAGSGNDTFFGGLGNDVVNSFNGNDVSYGGDGDDTINDINNDDTLYGGNGNDALIGGNGFDTVHGEADNDFVSGGNDADLLYGGDGVDTLYGGTGVDTLYGDLNDDLLFGGSAPAGFANTFYGGNDFDTVSYVGESAVVYADLGTGGGHVGGVLVDRIFLVEHLVGGSGNDVLVGNASANSLSGGIGTDLLFGGDGDDALVGGTAASGEYNQLFGGAGNDTANYAAEAAAVTASIAGFYAYVGGTAPTDLRDIYNSVEHITGGSANDSLEGDASANTLTGGAGSDLLFGGDGADLLFGGAAATGSQNQLFGGNGIDTASYVGETARVTVDFEGRYGYVGGTAPTDLRDLFNAIENLTGGSGNDLLAGDSANNVIDGGASLGNDTLFGRDGDDTLTGRSGSDLLFGGDGADLLFGGGAATGSQNQLFGGDGIDTASYVGETGKVTADLEGLYGYVGGTAPTDLRDLFNAIENLIGGFGNDLLAGDSANNVIDGGPSSGNDTLWGRGGGDTLSGDDGNDLLLGNDGIDTLTGGAGADRFFFFGTETDGPDAIVDFSSAATDKIVVVPGGFGTYGSGDTVFLATGIGSSDAIFAAHATQGFAYDTASGALYFDADGSGNASIAIQLATLVNLAALSASDFVVF